jgi:hypothetical protein
MADPFRIMAEGALADSAFVSGYLHAGYSGVFDFQSCCPSALEVLPSAVRTFARTAGFVSVGLRKLEYDHFERPWMILIRRLNHTQGLSFFHIKPTTFVTVTRTTDPMPKLRG